MKPIASAALAVLVAVILAATVRSHAADPSKAARGRDVFNYWCATCHGDGPEYPGTTALAAKYKGSKPALLEKRTDLTPEITEYYVRHGASVMPPFRKTEITDADLRALAAYLAGSNAKGTAAMSLAPLSRRRGDY
jgi:mono/diheme cytochrome c family protein